MSGLYAPLYLGGSAASGGEAVPFEGVLLKRNSPYVVQPFATAGLVGMPWEAVEYDDIGAWDVGTPHRITIPTGVTRVQLFASCFWDSITLVERYRSRISKNVGEDWQYQQEMTDTPSAASHTFLTQLLSTPVVPVVAGDWFELQAANYSDVACDFGHTADASRDGWFSWFQLVVIP